MVLTFSLLSARVDLIILKNLRFLLDIVAQTYIIVPTCLREGVSMSSEFLSYTFGKLIEDIRRLIQAGIGGVVNEIVDKKFTEIEEIKERLAGIEKILEEVKRSPTIEIGHQEQANSRLEGEITKGSGICKFEGCERSAVSRGYCKNHYYMLKRRGLMPNREIDRGPKRCSMDGCEKIAISRGLCKNHYYQFKRGTILFSDGKYIKKG